MANKRAISREDVLLLEQMGVERDRLRLRKRALLARKDEIREEKRLVMAEIAQITKELAEITNVKLAEKFECSDVAVAHYLYRYKNT